ncbi:MAG: hemolysin [Bacteroidetes bacterium HGW-Bacteroidetes-11]|jgi:CBS domain containing-hemolysin-like protein|nr:MAG: hemolysin [Bacteroidetes bacterium HGW-Bacteroidetes-11]
MELIVPIIIALLFSAFFSGMEIAFVTANKLRIEVEKNKEFLPARLLSGFLKKPSRFIAALLMGNNIALVIYGIYIAVLLEPMLIKVLPDSPGSVALLLISQTIISTLIVLLFAEFLPKVLFRINPNSILNFFAVPLKLFYVISYPVIIIFIGASEILLKYIFKARISHPEYSFGVVDLDHYLRDSSSQQPEESEDYQEFEMFKNARDLGNVKLRECMVPRNEIIAVSNVENLEVLRELFISSGHSKVLIYQESIDNIIGYTHSHDLFRRPGSIDEITKPVMIVPESMPANKLLSMFMSERKSVALVVDEFGGTAGMLTIEDIIEEIFGEIDDEYDVEDSAEVQISEDEFLFSARLEIDYLNQKYKLELPVSDEYETLAGLIISHHEDIPAEHEEIQIHDFLFIITRASESRIEEVRLKFNPT